MYFIFSYIERNALNTNSRPIRIRTVGAYLCYAIPLHMMVRHRLGCWWHHEMTNITRYTQTDKANIAINMIAVIRHVTYHVTLAAMTASAADILRFTHRNPKHVTENADN